MNTSFRRYEILLPKRFNDGAPVPKRLLTETRELRRGFGAVSSETQIVRGEWEDQGEIYRDPLVKVFVDVHDTPKSRTFFLAYRETLKKRFQQLAIWITSHPIDVL